ncbi:MAG: NlpC/P60 family protein [Proteobacteria bacterium]|nr:MAG: NlpC/P60 family protein [Pseudomonadota bacterium]
MKRASRNGDRFMFATRLHYLLIFGILMALEGCASAVRWTPPTTPQQTATQPAIVERTGVRVVRTAAGLVGAPYRYGGASPRGFDCSGLVYYSYRSAGVHVPRTTRDLYRTAQPIDLAELTPGDLLFFYFNEKVGHVAIYSGSNEFVHAPSSGKHVTRGSLNDRFWRERLVSAGRLL